MNARLCLFTDSTEPSGMGQHMLTLAAALRSRYDISFVCPPGPSSDAFLVRAADMGLECLALWAPFHDPDAVETLCKWLRARRFDLFHCHAGIGWEGFGGIHAAKAAGVSGIVRTEHLPYLLTHPVQKTDHSHVMTMVDTLICVSQKARSSYIVAGVPRSKVCVIHNGIDVPCIKPDRNAMRVQLGLPQAARVAITVGRLAEQKGCNYLLEAAPAVLKSVPDAYFVWIGDGPMQEALLEHAAHVGLADRVLFPGPRSGVLSLMAGADLFVLPSLFEGLPISVLEAMSLALPVVGTRVCGTSEVVVDGETGRLVPPRDPHALAQAVIETFSQPDLASRWGAAGRRRVRLNFTTEQMVRGTAAVYDDLLSKNWSATSNAAEAMLHARGEMVLQDTQAGLS
jgi:glycosyltransferase involved in cell wall biosynthesis